MKRMLETCRGTQPPFPFLKHKKWDTGLQLWRWGLIVAQLLFITEISSLHGMHVHVHPPAYYRIIRLAWPEYIKVKAGHGHFGVKLALIHTYLPKLCVSINPKSNDLSECVPLTPNGKERSTILNWFSWPSKLLVLNQPPLCLGIMDLKYMQDKPSWKCTAAGKHYFIQGNSGVHMHRLEDIIYKIIHLDTNVYINVSFISSNV